MEKRIQVGSSMVPLNLAWQVNGQVPPNPISLYSNAASSGFVSPTINVISPVSPHPVRAPSHYIVSSAPNSPWYYYQMKPQPTPQ